MCWHLNERAATGARTIASRLWKLTLSITLGKKQSTKKFVHCQDQKCRHCVALMKLEACGKSIHSRPLRDSSPNNENSHHLLTLTHHFLPAVKHKRCYFEKVLCFFIHFYHTITVNIILHNTLTFVVWTKTAETLLKISSVLYMTWRNFNSGVNCLFNGITR